MAAVNPGSTLPAAVVTGASGFIGARVVQGLLARGVRVYALGRARDGVPWETRMRAALTDITGTPPDSRLCRELTCVETDIAGAEAIPLTPPPPPGGVTLWHLAGDTKFTAAPTESQRRVNVAAGPHLVRVLGDVITRVLHVSTAYVAGARDGQVLESEFDVGQTFRNGYEATKLEGELRLREACQARNLPLIITRPAIVTNDAHTGRSSAFTHLNALVEIVRRLQQHFHLGFGEVVSRRIRVPIQPDRHPNMVTVDVVVEALLRIAAEPRAAGRVLHLCHPYPPAFRDVAALLLGALEIDRKLEVVYTSEFEEPLTYTEKMVMRAFKPYLAYLNADCTFDLTNTREILPDYDALFPPLTAAYLDKVVAFHRASAWTDDSAADAP